MASTRLSIASLALLFLFVFVPAAHAESSPVTYGTPEFYTFYAHVAADQEALTQQLFALKFTDPQTRKTFSLIPTGSDPMLHTAAANVTRIGGMTIPSTAEVETQSGATLLPQFESGSKISLVGFRIMESLPEQIRSSYTTAPSDVTISYNPENADLPYTFEGTFTTGRRIYEERLLKQIATHLATGNTSPIMLPLVERAPAIHTTNLPAEAGSIRDLVAYGESDFSGSSRDRIHNIATALARFNGLIIMPGEEFSFNTHLGPVDGSTGYREELVIKGPRTIPEYGGGVCQVSSTAFRAALFGGLDITERKNHSYAVSYYEPWGTDATIYPGVVDFKFRNDTPGALIMQAYMVEPHVYFKLYGLKDERVVSVEGPFVYGHNGPPAPILRPVSSLAPGQRQLTQHGVVGFYAHWNRSIARPDGTVEEETFKSNYEARPAHYNVGPAAAPTPETPEQPAG